MLEKNENLAQMPDRKTETKTPVQSNDSICKTAGKSCIWVFSMVALAVRRLVLGILSFSSPPLLPPPPPALLRPRPRRPARRKLFLRAAARGVLRPPSGGARLRAAARGAPRRRLDRRAARQAVEYPGGVRDGPGGRPRRLPTRSSAGRREVLRPRLRGVLAEAHAEVLAGALPDEGVVRRADSLHLLRIACSHPARTGDCNRVTLPPSSPNRTRAPRLDSPGGRGGTTTCSQSSPP